MFKDNLISLRKMNHMSQEELADRLHVSRQTLSKYETGENDIPTAVLIRLSEFYHVSTDYLLGLTDQLPGEPLFLARIRLLREEHDWTQQQVANRLHVHRRTYDAYEAGATDVPVEILIALARLYNVSTDYLLGESNDPQRH